MRTDDAQVIIRRAFLASAFSFAAFTALALPASAATKAPVATTVKPVTPGAFCAPAGAAGRDKTGRVMKCVALKGEKQPRWRA